MSDWFSHISSFNLISVLIICIIIGSLYQGVRRGASGSARYLFLFVMEGVFTVAGLFLAWKLAGALSPLLQQWLVSKGIQIPSRDIGVLQQLYYTLITGMRDFPLLRFGFIIIIVYAPLKYLLYWAWFQLTERLSGTDRGPGNGRRSLFSGLTGGTIGSVIGAARGLLMIAVLFIYVTLMPHAPLTQYIQASKVYKTGATQVIQPFTGDFIANKLPVFTRAVEDEFNKILQRKYEVIDQKIPDDIAAAAKEVTKNAGTDEEKARLLYGWVGTRIQYDWDKVTLYEEQQIWKEQTPEDTFATRKGVCIDYSRLYAVMAKAAGLEAKVVTGLGYDGQGSYGSHAWNEVYVPERKQWLPIDTTWVASGGNWFNPPDFYDTHVKEA